MPEGVRVEYKVSLASIADRCQPNELWRLTKNRCRLVTFVSKNTLSAWKSSMTAIQPEVMSTQGNS